jgi:hypothetical protein
MTVGSNSNMQTRRCSKCVQERPISRFQHISRAKGWASWCMDCNNAARMERWRRQADEVSKVKVERGCIDCGYNEHPAALHFDHRPGTVKLGDVARMTNGRRDLLWAEIEKCDVRCANCHAVKTAERRLEVAL